MKALSPILLLHDLSSYGTCSLKIAMPVFSVAGYDPCPVPTALLSMHTAYPHTEILDSSDYTDRALKALEKVSVPLEGVYTGFLGSISVLRSIRDFLDRNPSLPSLIDPVMGDHGKLYRTYTPLLSDAMKDLSSRADVLTPNLTEACHLSSSCYEGPSVTPQRAKDLMKRIQEGGAKNIILKGLVRKETELVNAILHEDGSYEEIPNRRIPIRLHGTGDLFASVLGTEIFRGASLSSAVMKAASFVEEAASYSMNIDGATERGVCFEPLLGKLSPT